MIKVEGEQVKGELHRFNVKIEGTPRMLQTELKILFNDLCLGEETRKILIDAINDFVCEYLRGKDAENDSSN